MKFLLVFGFVFQCIVGKPPHYTKRALTFLQEYGYYYNLFQRFLGDDVGNYELAKHKDAKLESISETYRIRNYSNDNLWEARADQFTNWNISYTALGGNDEYNNRYRFGTDMSNDRFVSIFFQRDPWTEDDASIHFVAIEPKMQGKVMVCKFTHPVEATSAVTVEAGFSDQVGHTLQKDNIISCPIPAEVKSALLPTITSISLDLILKEYNNHEVLLLKNLRVPRTHELDRRAFNFSITVVTNDVNDPLVLEWITHNILIGVEHFYIFDQRNYNIKVNLWEEPIRPFLDANIVTLIPYHYIWDGLQRTTFNVALQKFGHLNKWLGFQDIDEFFMPTGCINRTEINASDYPNLLLHHLRCLGTDWDQIPGVMYDLVEMGCADTKNTFLSSSPNRNAVTTHCNIAGFHFNEMKVGHGKMFLKPSKVKYLSTPHRYNHYDIVYAEAEVTKGMFYHFNNFRYSNDFPGGSDRREDNSLRYFTLNLLEENGFIKLRHQ